MAYTGYFNTVTTIITPVGSQASAMVYPGGICPQECNFGRVHGPAAARGSVTFKGAVAIPVAQQVVIQIGQSVFYGMAVKGGISQSATGGNSTNIGLVDMRDRLHDYNHFAQYNMVSNEGAWWHILPADWRKQRRTFVKKMQTIADFKEEQKLPDLSLDNLKDCPPMLSAMSILQDLAKRYGFDLSYDGAVEKKLRKSYPENCDFNRGVKVSDCIESVLSRFNMRWTAWGDLVVHVTESGVPSTPFESAILSGNINLCNYNSYQDSELGSDLNERGRRVKIVGGRDQHEWWYPCLPDWNYEKWTWDICNDTGYQFAALLGSLNLTRLSLMREMPLDWQDERKFNGKPRNDMTIADYVESVCFKVYRADSKTECIEGAVAAVQETFASVIDADPDAPAGYWLFPGDYDAWLANRMAKPDSAIDFIYPVSQNLGTDTTLRHYVKSHSRKIQVKGERDVNDLMNGAFAYLLEGTSLEIEEYITTDKNPDGSPIDHHCNELYKVRVIFSEKCYSGTSREEVSEGGKKVTAIEVKPGHVYLRVSTDRDIYLYTMGDSPTAPRVRELIRDFQDLKKTFVDGVEQPMLCRNFIEAGFINAVLPDEIAKEVAAGALNHEFISTAGHITFRTNAGFMPSGIVESVNVTFSAQQGVREQVNFTNQYNDERIPSFFTMPRKTGLLSEERVALRKLQEEARIFLTQQAAEKAGKKENVDGSPTARANVFGNNQNAAAAKVSYADQIEYDPGDIMVVKESGTPSTV